MSNNNEFWGRRFGYIDATKGRIMSYSGFGAKPRTNKANPNRPETLQSKKDKKRFEEYVKKFGRPTVYYKSNGVKDAEKTRIHSPNISTIRI
jgi:hypothetical protein